MKDIVILGGPNGAGKTTAAQVVVPSELEIREFINADEIARGVSPFNAQIAGFTAGRLMIERIRVLVAGETSFAFETTCAGHRHGAWLRECRRNGWRVSLVFLWLPSPLMAIERVARRVAEGGHGVGDEVVARRWSAGAKNLFRLYLPLADIAAIYDNSDEGRTLMASLDEGAGLVVRDFARWAALERAAA